MNVDKTKKQILRYEELTTVGYFQTLEKQIIKKRNEACRSAPTITPEILKSIDTTMPRVRIPRAVSAEELDSINARWAAMSPLSIQSASVSASPSESESELTKCRMSVDLEIDSKTPTCLF